MKDLGEAKKILGMEIMRDRFKHVLYLSQRRYIEKVVQHFSMGDAKLLFLPLILIVQEVVSTNKGGRRATF